MFELSGDSFVFASVSVSCSCDSPLLMVLGDTAVNHDYGFLLQGVLLHYVLANYVLIQLVDTYMWRATFHQQAHH